MKNDIVTSVFAAIAGTVIAFFVCNIFVPGIEDFSFSTLQKGTTYTLSEPNPEVFNFRSVNPTVEVFVGQCEEYDSYGNCIDQVEIIEDPNILPNNPESTDDNATPVDSDQTNQNSGDSLNGTTD